MEGIKLSIDTLKRAQERLEDSFERMTTKEANTMPAPLIKSVTWLIWHTAKEIDEQVSDLSDQSSLWSTEWFDRFAFDLPKDTEDWRHTPEEAAKVVIQDRSLLLAYLQASMDRAIAYFKSIDETTLDEIIDDSWTPPVTREVRLVSVIDDAVMHSGQAVYTRRLVIEK